MTAFCTSMRRTPSGAAERCVYPVGHTCQHRHVLSDSPSFPRLPLPDEEGPSVQCVCGRRKQPRFICDFCYSAEAS